MGCPRNRGIFILYFRHVNNAAAIEHRLPLLDGVKHLAAVNAPLWVFSLNHDLIMECVAARHNIPLNCGLSGEVVTLPRRDLLGVKKGELRAQVLNEEGLEKTGMPFLRHGSAGVNLLKIHGALDVFTFRNGKDLLKLLPVEQTVAGVLETLRAANEDLLCPDPGAPDGKVKAMNEIAYTDDEGEMQFLRRSLLAGAYKFDPHRDQVLPKRLLDYFRQYINHVSSLVCIGYGFGDIHVNQVIRDWLGFAAARRLEIVRPGISAIPSFLQHLAPQVVLTDSCATDYLDRSAGIVRTRAEIVQRKFDTWARGRKRKHVEREMAAFLRQRRERLFNALATQAEQLPMRDGDLDIEALGESPQQLARRLVREVGGTAEDLLEEFISSQDAEQSLPATMPTHNEIAVAAYFRWLQRGSGHGQDREDWVEAERELGRTDGQ